MAESEKIRLPYEHKNNLSFDVNCLLSKVFLTYNSKIWWGSNGIGKKNYFICVSSGHKGPYVSFNEIFTKGSFNVSRIRSHTRTIETNQATDFR